MQEKLKGIGPTPARYVVVGEAYTKWGEKRHEPFSGSGAVLLNKVLSQCGMKAGQTYYTNAIPYYTEKLTRGACDLNHSHLVEELREVKPDVILACGGWASYALVGNTRPISEVCGAHYWSVEFQAHVIVTYHPNAIPYNPELFSDFTRAARKFMEFADKPKGELTYPIPNLHQIKSVEAWETARDVLENPVDGVAAVDIETEGFDFLRQDILSIGIGPTNEDVYIFNEAMIEREDVQQYLNELFGRRDICWVYQNGKFDVKFMRSNPDPKAFGKQKKCVIPNARCDFDTMIAHYCLDERQGTHGLKQWARELFDAPDWEADIKKWLPKKDTPYSAIPEDVLHKYQSYDVYYTRKGYYKFTELMIQDNVYDCFKNVYCPAVEAFTEIELAGVPIDIKKLRQVYDDAQPAIAAATKKVQDAAAEAGWSPEGYVAQKNKEKEFKWKQENMGRKPEDWTKAPGKTEVPKVFNPKSHPQLSYVAYDLCKVPLFEGKKTCGKEAVDLYRHRHPFWKALAEYKEVTDLYGTFIKGLLEHTGPDNRVHMDVLLHGTRTGRISCTVVNMQNQPRDSIAKDFFIPDDADSVVVNFDFKTLEVVIAAILSDDEKMKEPFIKKLDFHSETAKAVFGPEIEMLQKAVAEKDRKPIDQFLERTLMMEIRHSVDELLDQGDFDGAYHKIWKHLRFLTKFVTFGVMYGRGAESLAKGELNCSIPEAQGYVNQFFARYPKYYAWLKQNEKEAIELGENQNVFGFKRRWPLVTKENAHEVRNQSWNGKVQGSASQVCMQALCRIQKHLLETGWGRVMFTVHDSIVYSLKKATLQSALTYIHAEMTRDIIGTDVQLEAEGEVGPSYKRVKEVVFDEATQRWIPAEEDEWLKGVLKNAT